MMLTPVPTQIAAWWPLYVCFTSGLVFAGTFGLWQMKKWGLISYFVALSLVQLVSWRMHEWNAWTLAPLLVVGFVGCVYFAKVS